MEQNESGKKIISNSFQGSKNREREEDEEKYWKFKGKLEDQNNRRKDQLQIEQDEIKILMNETKYGSF